MSGSTNGYARPTPEERDPFFRGYREVRQRQPDGTAECVRVPLTKFDLLHPKEGDAIVHGLAHDADCALLRDAFGHQLRHDPTGWVFHDVGVYYVRARYTHHSPDITVVLGAAGLERDTGMYRVSKYKVMPALVVEVVSRSTRDIDLVDKVREYYEVGMPLYVIVDRPGGKGPPRLIGYERGPTKFVEMTPDARGRLWLEPVRAWIAVDVERNRTVCYDAAGHEIGDYNRVADELAAARKSAAAAKRKAARAEKKVTAAHDRIRALEAELARLRGRKK